VLDEGDMVYGDAQLRAVWDELRAQLPETCATTLATSTLPASVLESVTADLPSAKLVRSKQLHTTRPGVEERLIDCSTTSADGAWAKRVGALKAELRSDPFRKVLVLCSGVRGCRRLHAALEEAFETETTASGRTPRVLSLHSGIEPAERASTMRELVDPLWRDEDTSSEDLALERAAPPLVLLSTERSMRGVDMPQLEHVFIFDFPKEGAEYIRAVGRATRGDGPPARVSYLAQGGQLNFAKALMSLDEGERPITIDRR